MPIPPDPAAAIGLPAADHHALRERIADRIERDIALLDAIDGDPDLEDGTDAEATAAEWTGDGAHRFTVGEAA